jgi:glycerophosphoryl diester phosphodiesterase
MAHRGGSREYVENTLPAFRHAAKLNASILEMDVQLTKDGKVVIFHDTTLQRMCGVSTTIGDYDYSDLPNLIVPMDLASKHEVINDPLSIKIPLFQTVLDEFPTSAMQVDVKHGPEELVVKVGNMIKNYKREHLTVWGTFQPSTSRLCSKHFGTQIPLFFDLFRFLQAFTLYKIGLLWTMDFKESALISPTSKYVMDPTFIKALKAKGCDVIFFGTDGSGAINHEEDWAQVLSLGDVGICSDRPLALKAWLTQREKI